MVKADCFNSGSWRYPGQLRFTALILICSIDFCLQHKLLVTKLSVQIAKVVALTAFIMSKIHEMSPTAQSQGPSNSDKGIVLSLKQASLLQLQSQVWMKPSYISTRPSNRIPLNGSIPVESIRA